MNSSSTLSAVHSTAVPSGAGVVILPAVLAVVMLGLGLTLTLADFRRITAHPRPVIIALACQLMIIPTLCFALVTVLGMVPVLAMGMMLLVATPGGTVASVYSYLAGGDVALNVSLTAITSILAVVTTPVIVNVSAAHFMHGVGSVGLDTGAVSQVAAYVLVPTAIGLAVRHTRPDLAGRLERPLKITSLVVLMVLVVASILSQLSEVPRYLAAAGLAAGLLSLMSLAVGYTVARVARTTRRQSISISLEVGVHNSVVAISLALSPQLLANETMAIPAAIYAVISLVLAGLFTLYLNQRGTPLPGGARSAGP